MNYKTNKKELCVRSVYNIYPKWKEFAQIHDWIYNEDYTTECSQCHAKGNFKVKELIKDEFGNCLPMDHENIKAELEKWHDYYGSFGNCECSISDLLEGEDYTEKDKENEDFLWELWIEREATFCGNMGEYTEVEYYVVHKILADIEKSRKKRKSR